MEAAAVDFSGLISALTGMVSMTEILSFLALGITACGVFFLGWMGIRKLTNMVTTAVRGGHIDV